MNRWNQIWPALLLLFWGCNLLQENVTPDDQAFVKFFGAGGKQQGAHSLQQTSDGGYILVGYRIDDTDNDSQIHVVKTDSAGNLVWDNDYGGEGDDLGFYVKETSDGGFVIAGYVTENAFQNACLLRIDANGDSLWLQSYGNTAFNDVAHYVEIMPDDGYLLTGHTENVDVNKPSGSPTLVDVSDIFTVRADVEGNELWSKTDGFSGEDEGVLAATLADDQYAVLGYTDGLSETGQRDLLIFLLNEYGNEYDRIVLETSTNDSITGVHKTTDGGWVVAASATQSTGDQDVLIAEFTADFELADSSVWPVYTGTSNTNEYANDIIETSDGSFLICGSTEQNSAGGTDILVEKIDPATGSVLWRQTFGESENDEGSAIIEDSQGRYVLCGTIQFGNSSVMCLIKLNQNGEILP